MVPTYPGPRSGEQVGEALRRERLTSGLSQTEVAARAGMSRPNLAAIEAGRRRPSIAVTERVLAAIHGTDQQQPRLRLSPQVLYNIELSRAAAFELIKQPDVARRKMQDRLDELKAKDDGGANWWIERWADLLGRWDVAAIVALLISTDPADIDARKVSPIGALLTEDMIVQAARRAREVWYATRRTA